MSASPSQFPHPLRVLHVLTSLEPGGLENGVVNLANHLDPERFQISIVCLERVGAFRERLRNNLVVKDLAKSSGFHWSAVEELARCLGAERPSILHTHNLGPLIYGVLSRAKSMRSIPILHGEHGALSGGDLTRKRLWQRRLLYLCCRKVHTVSAALRDHLVELEFPRSKIVPVLNGVDCRHFRPATAEERLAARELFGLPLDAVVIGLVGRFIASKRHLLLLDAFAQIKSEWKAAGLWLLWAGDGGEDKQEVLNALGSHPQRNAVVCTGHLNDPADVYRAIDLLAMPSSVEGLSNALLEAMACGVPCLAHRACGASEVIEHGTNGVLADIEQADQLSRALQEALEDRHRLQGLGRQARSTAELRFSLDSMMNGYARLYEEVARKPEVIVRGSPGRNPRSRR